MLIFTAFTAVLFAIRRLDLRHLSLQQFADQFERAGVDNLDDLALLTEDDLTNFGLNLVQRRRLQKHLSTKHDNLEAVRTFGSAGKAVSLVKGENELYNHTCSQNECILRHMWFGGNWPHYDIQRLRVYVDGESAPSIDGQLFLLHGVGFADQAAPWSSGSLFGKTGMK